MIYPSSQELAAEALASQARTQNEKTPDERFRDLVQAGWINTRGEITTVLGGDAEPENQ